jgi:hypothetical protein
MRRVIRVFITVAQALSGAYVGAMLFFLVLYLTQPAEPESRGLHFDWTSARELLTAAFAGVAALVWWIVPIGIVFSRVLSPRIEAWPRSTAATRGALLGAILGLLTSIAFLFAARGSATPAPVIRTAFVFLPIYCAVWCAMYSRRIAAPR